MVEPAMVGWVVHGYLANAAITCSKMEQIAQKICIYQTKVVPLHTVFIFEFGFMVNWTPLAAIARGVFCLFGLKDCPFYEKSTFL